MTSHCTCVSILLSLACNVNSQLQSNCTTESSLFCAELAGDYMCICNGYRACYQQTIQCKNDQSCMVFCNGAQSCLRSVISCPNSTTKNHQCGIWCDLQSGLLGSCEFATINAYTSELFVKGAGDYVLYYATIEAQKSANLTMIASGKAAFARSKIYCPSNANNAASKTCNIAVSNFADFGGFFLTEIISNTSFDGLNMVCSGYDNVSDCWGPANLDSRPMMHCGDSTDSVECDMESVDGIKWNCKDSNNKCYKQSNSPTVDPTSYPTNYPSAGPTEIPTNAIGRQEDTGESSTFWSEVNNEIYMIIAVILIIVVVICILWRCGCMRRQEVNIYRNGLTDYDSIGSETGNANFSHVLNK